MLKKFRRAVLSIAALVYCGIFEPVLAVAQTSPDRPPAVLITYDPTVPQSMAAVDAMKAHLTGMPVRTLVQPLRQTNLSLSERLDLPGELASEQQAIGAFSIEVNKRGDILVFFTEPDGRSALVRRVSSESNEPGVLREEAAVIVRSLVQALLDGKRIGMTESDSDVTTTPDSSPPPEPPSAPTPPLPAEPPSAPAPSTEADSHPSAGSNRSPPSPLFSASAGYVVTRFASGAGLESGVTIGARWFPVRQGYVGGSYAFFPSLVSGNSSATVSVARHPLDLTVGYESRSTFAPILEAALLVDFIHRSTLETSSDLHRTTDSDHVALGGGLRAGVSWGPVDWLRGAARLGADIAVSRPVYVSRLGDVQTVLEPAILRPRFDLGLAVYGF